jgi:hypothetical protein
MYIQDAQLSLKLDPWAASSLLQKAIRRGDAKLARHAARTLYRQRGNAIWRRLITIAFEDVGIAEPELVAELTRLATDKSLRAVVGEGMDLILDLCSRLAAAPKDRSADYLFCGALKLPAGQCEREPLTNIAMDERIAIAADPSQPLMRRAVATLANCTVDGAGLKATCNPALERLVVSLQSDCPSPVHDACALAAKKGCDAIVLMVPLLWSVVSREAVPPTVEDCTVPPPALIGRLPLYTFDKHTSAGKQAITLFAQENPEVRDVLSQHVPEIAAREVALIAAFYADAMPVARKLIWSQSQSLETLGLEADMIGAGCPKSGIGPVMKCVTRNLGHLNNVRRRLVLRRAGQ